MILSEGVTKKLKSFKLNLSNNPVKIEEYFINPILRMEKLSTLEIDLSYCVETRANVLLKIKEKLLKKFPFAKIKLY